MLATFENPISISTIKSLTRGNTDLKILLFSQAVTCVAADNIYRRAEEKFIKQLAKELNISAIDRDRILEENGIEVRLENISLNL